MFRLFDADAFVPRSMCGPGWSNDLAVLSQIGDAVIALSYFGIPAVLFALWWSRRRTADDFKVNWVILCFVAFILLCGLTHVCDVLAFHWPAYRLFTLITCLTALVSAFTAYVLPWAVLKLSGAPSLRALIGDIEDMHCQALRADSQLRIERLIRQDVENELAAERVKSAALERSLASLRDAQHGKVANSIEAAREKLTELADEGGQAR